MKHPRKTRLTPAAAAIASWGSAVGEMNGKCSERAMHPAWKLLESLGFRRIGTIENADELKGSVSDEYSYELGPGAWAESRA